jgi:hypothetical protein
MAIAVEIKVLVNLAIRVVVQAIALLHLIAVWNAIGVRVKALIDLSIAVIVEPIALFFVDTVRDAIAIGVREALVYTPITIVVLAITALLGS